MNSTATETKELALPEPVMRRQIPEAKWRTLMDNLYPGAESKSVCMVWDYCVARGLDPMKKPCHIVPMKVKVAGSKDYIWRDVVMPGIYEYRTTAHRTGEYMGHSPPEYGGPVDVGELKVPEWCSMTFYRWNPVAKIRVEFPVKTFFYEVAGFSDNVLNKRWTQAPIQMLTKCCEAAGLREAFPDEFGGTHTVEEMAGRVIEGETVPTEPGGSDRSGRPDTQDVNWELRDKWVSTITDTLNSDADEYAIAEALRAIDAELTKFDALYTSVLDLLAAEKIITKKAWREYLRIKAPADGVAR